MSEPVFFPDQAGFRSWLEANHASAREIVAGFEKGAAGTSRFTRSQAVDEALCFGWIDGVVKGGAATWSVRFTPRGPRSIWSAVNLRRFDELRAEGRVHPAGLAAFEGRDLSRQKQYAHENRDATLSAAELRIFKADAIAWQAFEAMPPGYRRAAIWWVVSAVRESTRQRRLATLIADSAAGRQIKPLARPAGKASRPVPEAGEAGE